MAEYLLKSDSCNTLSVGSTVARGSTFVKLTGQQSLTDPRRDDTLRRIHDQQVSVGKRQVAEDNRTQPRTEPVTTCCDDEGDRSSALTGLALARIQHRAKKSSTIDNANTSLRLQERRGSNPDRGTRFTSDDPTPHVTSEMTSHRESPARAIERPTSSWASKSGRRPKYTDSGWDVEDGDFVDSRIEKMEISDESNCYTVRRSSVNEASCHSSTQGKSSLSLPTGHHDQLTRRSSDSSRARSYKEVAKELRREAALVAGSHRKKDETHSNGSTNNSSSSSGGISMTNGELARMRAVSRLSHATPQLANESTSSMGSTARHLPRKLNPLPASQVIGTDMALEEEEAEEEEEEEDHDAEEEARLVRQHRHKCSSLVNSGGADEQALRRRGSRDQGDCPPAIFFSGPNTTEKNIIPRPKLKPIARK